MELQQVNDEYWQVLDGKKPVAFIYTGSWGNVERIGFAKGIASKDRLAILHLCFSHLLRLDKTNQRAKSIGFPNALMPSGELVTADSDSGGLMDFTVILPSVKKLSLNQLMQYIGLFDVEVVEESDFDSIDAILKRVLGSASLDGEVSFSAKVVGHAVVVQFTVRRSSFLFLRPSPTEAEDRQRELFYLTPTGAVRNNYYDPVAFIRPPASDFWNKEDGREVELSSVRMIISASLLRGAKSQANLAYLLRTLLGKTEHHVRLFPKT